MTHKRSLLVALVIVSATILGLDAGSVRSGTIFQAGSGGIEPGAGMWRTWVLGSGSQMRLPAPPDRAATEAEIGELRALAAQRDAAALDLITFWDAGAPGYRWDQILWDQIVKSGGAGAVSSRPLSLMHVAIYDATIAAWDSKYVHNRPRPSEFDPTLTTALINPRSPSYPSEHAVTAGAAATVLAYLYPNDAAMFAARAEEAARSRLLAGVQYPSDVTAGLDLGRRVAALVVERARSDGSDLPWTGSIPTEPGKWSLAGYPAGTTPAGVTAGTWKPWVLTSGSQVRPGPPPAFGSPEGMAEMAEVRDFSRTVASNTGAFYWNSTRAQWLFIMHQKLFEYRLDANPPRAARVAATTSVAYFDAFVACFDAKYTYWAMRPFQVDPTWTPLFPTPSHPSYPAAHGCADGANAGALAYFFPRDAAFFEAQAKEAAMSRLWAGIHFTSDITAGLALGFTVADLVIARARTDGAQ